MSTSLCRRSSHVSRWLTEVQTQSDPSTPSDVADLSDVDPVGTRCNPYLAYPHMNTSAFRQSLDDTSSIHDYVLVDNEALDHLADQPFQVKVTQDPSAPPDTASPRSTVRLANAPPPSPNFHLSIRPSSPSVSSSNSRSPSRLSMFHKSSPADPGSRTSLAGQHVRSSSAQVPIPPAHPQLPGRWRPSVLGHFPSASVPDTLLSPNDALLDRSRPSMSSTNTFTTSTTVYEDGDSPIPSSTPSKASSIFGSLRSRTDRTRMVSQPPHTRTSSSPPVWTQPRSSTHLPQPPGLSRTLVRKASTLRLPFTARSRSTQSTPPNQVVVEEQGDSHPHVLYTGRGTGPRMSLSSINGHSRKKKLVISGIALNDVARLEAVQRWCQSFGEIDQITRMPNGDLHVNFRRAEVADTVCRVRARVHITGVGSVHLSWVYGHKRS
ncbi:hypothetical protein SCLCIDRAFT_12738 [Scleroderma citrinum Foug A]|uniref:RRM domain-containing protein n=1 Tax=Scleroderma citrinum Foug A TaxID=1036808 RepID=A0A0C3EPU9_9AGAM|nr:hypothetical protein SCLCIDRAFT_12738 [Scleroderma citrinum Foug A]